MLPAFCTKDVPPDVNQKEIAIFVDGWKVKKDYRGMYQCDESLTITLIDYIGDVPSECVVITKEQAQKIQEDPLYYIVKDKKLIQNPNYETEKKKQRENLFKSEFFETSLGWIRRKVTMKDGSTKDFLADLLLPIKAGLELGQSVEIITYSEPDFSKDITTETIIKLQSRKKATIEFIQECLWQTVADFGG